MIGVATGCAVNPATGSRQLILVSESQEIQMGREADEDIVPALGLVDDPALQEYVQDLGNRMARASERPGLPWTFRVVDDPVVNAFALPGGFVYVTRGILTHFSSEAELAGVVGHEIGHVTARHGAAQMSRAQLAQIGLGVGSILAPDLAPYADLAGAGFQILFLSYGRDAERQADDLGLRYMTALGYEPRAMAATFEMLATASGARDGDRLPGFLSTHPDPLSRRDRILEQAEAFEPGGTVERESYLRRLEGMPFGTNPRNGYFEGASFIHPELAFQVDLPEGWGGTNEASAVQAASPERDAILALEIVEAASPREARERFLAGGGVTGLSSRDTPVNGLTAAWTEFSAQTEEGTLDGTAVFLEHQRPDLPDPRARRASAVDGPGGRPSRRARVVSPHHGSCHPGHSARPDHARPDPRGHDARGVPRALPFHHPGRAGGDDQPAPAGRHDSGGYPAAAGHCRQLNVRRGAGRGWYGSCVSIRDDRGFGVAILPD